MKKFITLILVVAFLLCGCNLPKEETPKDDAPIKSEMVGIWITFSEISDFFSSPEGFEAAFNAAVEKAKGIGVNTLFVHVRAFCDAVYQSSYFPKASYVNTANDPLTVMCDIAAKHSMEIHAWINPYRVSTASSDINTLPQDSPAYIWLNDETPENDVNVCFTDSGIYLNPAAPEVKKLILKGVRVIIDNYEVAGIHFDDYFYPTTDAAFDEAAYKQYQSTAELPLTLAEWRRMNVNSLINSVYCAVKEKNSAMQFGVSPAADLDRCYNTLYADIEGWIGGGYIDYIMPQLYFGFEYPRNEFCFDMLFIKWQDLTAGKVKMYVGLPFYKVGTDMQPDKDEWNAHDDIIARQIALLKENNTAGYVYFSYSSVFSSDALNVRQLENVKSTIA